MASLEKSLLQFIGENGFHQACIWTKNKWKSLVLNSSSEQSRLNTKRFPAAWLPCAGLNFLRGHHIIRQQSARRVSVPRAAANVKSGNHASFANTGEWWAEGEGMSVPHGLFMPHPYYIQVLVSALKRRIRECLFWCCPSQARYFLSALCICLITKFFLPMIKTS